MFASITVVSDQRKVYVLNCFQITLPALYNLFTLKFVKFVCGCN